MKHTSLILIPAALLALVSCSREQFSPETPGVKTVLSCSISESVKTTLGELNEGSRKVYWADGDKVAVNGVESEALSGLEDECTSVEFTFDGILNHPYNIVYPSSIWNSGTSVTLPSKSTNIPMYGYSAAAGNVSISLMTSVVKLSLKKAEDAHNIRRIEVTALDGGQMSGEFAFNFETGILTRGSSATGNDAVVYLELNDALTTAAKEYFIPVPAGEYGIKVKIIDAEGHYMEKATTSSKTFTAGKILAFPELSFVPTGTEMGIEIANAEDWNAFATAYNNGEYDASQIATITGDLDFLGNELVTIKEFSGTVKNDGEYAFRNLTLASQPVFTRVLAGAVVSGLRFDDTNAFTVTSAEKTSDYQGLVAGRNAGTIENGYVASTINFSFVKGDTFVMDVAGFAGYNNGTISNCEMAGTIVCNTVDAETDCLGRVEIGGIAGYSSGSSALVDGCTFSGKILVGANAGEDNYLDSGILSTMVSSGQRFAGICGRTASSARVTNCETTSSALIDVRGKIAYLAAAGIVAHNTAYTGNCTNNAMIKVASNCGDITDSGCNEGGVVGRTSSSSTIENCVNAGVVSCSFSGRHNYIGGIVGYLLGNITSCNNSGTVWQGEFGPRYIHIGGICGQNLTSNWSGTIVNTGTVNPTKIGPNVQYGTINAGGLAGRSDASIDGLGTMYNEGMVDVLISPDLVSGKTYGAYNYVNCGGIVGLAMTSSSGTCSSISNFTNKGKIYTYCDKVVAPLADKDGKIINKYYKWTAQGGILGASAVDISISNCVNAITGCTDASAMGTTDYNKKGKVGVQACFDNDNVKSGSYNSNWVLGGILGIVDDPAKTVTISNCTNSSSVSIYLGTTAVNNRLSIIGGIAGKINSKSASISQCVNTGKIFSYNRNGTATLGLTVLAAGVVGYMEGTQSAPASISGSSSSCPSGLFAYRGYIGGLAGYLNYVNVGGAGSTNACAVQNDFSANSSVINIGGLAAWACNSSISNCTCKGNLSTAKTIGGLVGKLSSGSSVSDCVYSGTLTPGATALFAGFGEIEVLEEGNVKPVATNCGIAGTVNGTAITADNLSTYFTASPANVTVSGTYLYTE